jgi:hypothetical protein
MGVPASKQFSSTQPDERISGEPSAKQQEPRGVFSLEQRDGLFQLAARCGETPGSARK